MKTIAKFSVDFVRCIDPDGKPVAELPNFAGDQSEMLKMYKLMVLTRVFDTKAINLQRTGKLGTYASCLGHEAAHVAIGAAMRPEDCLAPMYREYGIQFWRGVKMSDVLLYWGGDERGNDYTRAPHDFAWCVPIATQYMHATGAANAFKLRGEKRCALAVIGDGGTSEGAFYEAMNFAGVRKLPIVYLTVNNRWAISVPLKLQTACETLAQKGFAAGIPGVQVDGNDLIAVRQVVGQALERARNGEGPTLIEAMTYRLSDHTTADDASRYRDQKEVDEAWKLEPMIRTRKYLGSIGAWDDKQEKDWVEECTRQVDEAVAEYLGTPKNSPESMFDHLYAELPEALEEQRETAANYFGKGGH